ncbi:hypothetical protein KW503_12340 [Vibrio fluvialis]|uniref:hypothetical protein n=1 Tax=Vibrio parahaemolyticus TaxID=670 RepID=UPI00041808B1|nr:hypothetical protein [Vibrio parahaemolyticus]MBY8171914.1 hypothetical protein [Vibrio fluvialis]HCH3224901.1 hypothetical protein [Vibrio parahaemolyticus]
MYLEVNIENGSIASEAGLFCKWINQHHPSIEVKLPANQPKLKLNDSSLILPLVTLISEPDLLNYLNLTVEYLNFKFRGDLATDKNEVSVCCHIKNSQTGTEKIFEFKGPESLYREKVDNFDLNEFFKD